ncbi:MAG: NADH/ubiquinone/plastoquinone (complex I), partial [Candidatus Omnitrophica bacterium]|nr:NADH/ubiquinone/plastoquinone (complex I) [Candidatus Omnitrophota bacterium]
MDRMINIIPLFVIMPLGGAFILTLFRARLRKLPDILANIVTLCVLVLSLVSVFKVSQFGTMVYQVGVWKPPIGIAMVLDSLTSFMLVTVNLVAFLITVYSANYMEKYTAKWNFYTLFLLMLAGMNGVVVTGDMFNLFVF